MECQLFPKTAPAAGKERVGGKSLLGPEQVEALGGQGRDCRTSQLSLGHRTGGSEPAISPESACLLHQAPPESPRQFSCGLTPSHVRKPERLPILWMEKLRLEVCHGLVQREWLQSLFSCRKAGLGLGQGAAGHIPEPSAHLGDWPAPDLLVRG